MSSFLLPYGTTFEQISLPPVCKARLFTPNRVELAESPNSEIIRALDEPIGSLRLSELASAKKNAVILVSDQTRLAPTKVFLPYLVEEIVRGGIRRNDITVVVAAGAHRPATGAEVMELVGENIYNTMECLNSSHEPKDCVEVGRTSRGTPVQVFHRVTTCELKVATGNIEPHWMAAFSGGSKALVPGTSSRVTIEKNHALSVKGNISRDPSQNTVRADLEEAAALAGLDFIFNVVVDHQGRLVRAFAGHPVQAHRAGCLLSGQVYYAEPGPPADIVIASAGGMPKDQNLYQAVKALQNAAAVVKPGGTLVLAARCREGYGNESFRSWVEAGQSEAETLECFSRCFVLGGHKAAAAARVTRKCCVHLLSDLPGQVTELLHCHSYHTLQEAVVGALGRAETNNPDVLIMPYAGLTFSW
ncbi:MAG: nickel-dependent lactate racemase [Desulfotomaculaceae bacterium]|nr:nickel-dependent lactate racemase [Desulfotomaculaceae bacterium]